MVGLTYSCIPAVFQRDLFPANEVAENQVADADVTGQSSQNFVHHHHHHHHPNSSPSSSSAFSPGLASSCIFVAIIGS